MVAATAISVAAVRLDWWSGVFCIKSEMVLAWIVWFGKSFLRKVAWVVSGSGWTHRAFRDNMGFNLTVSSGELNGDLFRGYDSDLIRLCLAAGW